MSSFPNRPPTAPDFLLSRAHGSVRTQGSLGSFSDPYEAVAALRDKRVKMVVGALPFDRNEAAALTIPQHIIRSSGPLEPPAHYRIGPKAQVHGWRTFFEPSLHEHQLRVEKAIDTISQTRLEKVVLARMASVEFSPPVDPLLVAARLIDRSPQRDGYLADLSPAGGRFEGRTLVGSSPEVLVRKQGDTITAYPLAGSARRHDDPKEDKAIAQDLYASAKDLHEHAFVVRHLEEALRPVCSELSFPEHPELASTKEMWHLATPITGRLRDPNCTALELALRTHPTPAICGTPTDAAEALITATEAPRHFYAGAVGWCDNTGDGEYMVAIRCAEISPGGDVARLWAGGGIVADSDASAEVQETLDKMSTLVGALGMHGEQWERSLDRGRGHRPPSPDA